MGLAGISGTYLPWRDVLHDGPVPADMDLVRLSRLRAEFIVSRNWGGSEDVQTSFAERNRIIQSYRDYDRITLWFEHDLYDQLQILEVLDWFSRQQPPPAELTMICTDQYLGHCSPPQLAALDRFEKPVTASQLGLANTAWAAFRQPSPQPWCDLLLQDTSALPYLQNAILRMLQEYPSVYTGLSRTEQSILQLISKTPNHPGALFGEQQHTEKCIFMGDLSFWYVLDGLLEGDDPLLELPGGTADYDPRNREDILSLTRTGESVLRGKVSWVDIRHPDKWLGGVHVHRGNRWFWDEKNREITRRDR